MSKDILMVADAVSNEHYFRQVLGIDAPPGDRPS